MLTFFACMAALWTDTTLESAQESVLRPGTFGAVAPSFDTAFEVNRKVTTHLLSVFPAALVGVVTGALAAGFTGCSLAIGRLRERAVGKDKRRQVIEPVVIMIVYTLVAMLLPLAFACTSSGCVLDHTGASGSAGGGKGSNLSYPSGGAPAPAPHASLGSEVAGSRFSGSSGGGSDGEPGVFCEGGSEHLHRVVEQSMLTFTCRSHRARARSHEPRALGPNNSSSSSAAAAAAASVGTNDYNELATLLHVSSEDAIRHLLTRGTHREFGYGPLLTFLLVRSPQTPDPKPETQIPKPQTPNPNPQAPNPKP
jgi:hypothetical protein